LSVTNSVPHNKQFTREAANVATSADVTAAGFDYAALAFEETGDFFGLLQQSDYSLAVTREYEHFLLTLDGTPDGPLQSPFPLPHPSGFWFDRESRELVVSSTRTPNMLIWFAPFDPTRHGAEVVPADFDPPAEDTLFLPQKARYLPGTLYLHDVVKLAGAVYATATGHNFLARLTLDSGWERVWWPAVVDGLGPEAFNQNYLQLNSMAVGESLASSFFTAFSDLTSGAKPWKDGYGPRGKGVVFSAATREALYRGLTCPHSARFHDGRLWLCDSGFGSVGYIDDFASHDIGRTRYVEVAKAPGFTRGLAFAGDVMFVGLSKVIPKYEPYAPGLTPEQTRCGIWAFRASTGEFLASLSWPQGYQIYDIQVLAGVKRPRLPLESRPGDGINPLLRYLG
jgi:uncharacterized protein (TIGR03032 family)